VAGAECIVFRFIPAEKARQSTILFYCVKLIASAGQDLMCVCLVPDIPNQAIVRGIENVMHRDRQFDGTKTCSGMPAYARTGFKDKLANFVGDLLQVFEAKPSQVGW
jgi:hypothetical protein